jgi:hypothetical protein
VNSCHAGAGCDWNGLNSTPFKILTFDVQGAPPHASAGSNVFVILDGTNESGDDGVSFFSLNDASSAVDLKNGLTRYSIASGATSSANQSTTPDKINRIIFQQYPSASSSTASVELGNILLNGNIHPVPNMTPTACPPITGDESAL